MTLLVGGIDVVLHRASLGSGEESSLFLNLEENLPCGIGERVGEFFDEVRTGRWVNHLVEVTLFLEQELLVACYTLREVGRSLVGFVKWAHHDRIHSSNGSRHGFGLGAEQVDIAVKHGHIIRRGGGIDHHHAGAVALGLILLDDFGPKHTCGAEFGNLHEIVFGDAHVELDLAGSKSRLNAGLYHLLQILITPSQGIAQLLHNICARVVECL